MAERASKAALAERHLGLVRGIAGSVYRRVGAFVELDELVSLGTTGLMEALRRYDPRSGVGFATFAHYRIRGAIFDGLRAMTQVPRRVWRELQALQRADAYLETRAASRATASQIRTPADELRGLYETLGGLATSLAASMAADAVPEPPPSPELELGRRQLYREITRALDTLPERERRLVTLHYFEGRSLVTAGAELGLSKSWASRLHARALDRLHQQLVRQRAV